MATGVLTCTSCGAALEADGVFPGGAARCSCGVETRLPEKCEGQAQAAAGPYRAQSERTSEAETLRCPFCGGPCKGDVRACPHCNVELASVRCPHCYALHFSGSRFCSRCGKELELEPLLDATDAPCPRCSRPLRAATGGASDDAPSAPLYECVGCGGLFIETKVLRELLARESDPARRTGLLASVGHAPGSSQPQALKDVKYVRCPMCHGFMNRTNFGRRSGVIVDVCKQHGTWFDAGELTAAVEFAASGGLSEAQRREVEEKEQMKHEAARAAASLQAELVRDTMDEGRGVGRWEEKISRLGRSGKTGLLDVLWELLR